MAEVPASFRSLQAAVRGRRLRDLPPRHRQHKLRGRSASFSAPSSEHASTASNWRRGVPTLRAPRTTSPGKLPRTTAVTLWALLTSSTHDLRRRSTSSTNKLRSCRRSSTSCVNTTPKSKPVRGQRRRSWPSRRRGETRRAETCRSSKRCLGVRVVRGCQARQRLEERKAELGWRNVEVQTLEQKVVGAQQQQAARSAHRR